VGWVEWLRWKESEEEKSKVKMRPLETHKVAAPGWSLMGFTGKQLCALESLRFNGLSRGELPFHVWFRAQPA
jgi:hypothetical protein